MNAVRRSAHFKTWNDDELVLFSHLLQACMVDVMALQDTVVGHAWAEEAWTGAEKRLHQWNNAAWLPDSVIVAHPKNREHLRFRKPSVWQYSVLQLKSFPTMHRPAGCVDWECRRVSTENNANYFFRNRLELRGTWLGNCLNLVSERCNLTRPYRIGMLGGVKNTNPTR